MSAEKPEERAIIHVEPSVENGTYANATTVIHSPNEFLLDFLMFLPGGRRKVVARIIVSPSHAKRLTAALSQNVSRYESVHGPIDAERGLKEEGFGGTVN